MANASTSNNMTDEKQRNRQINFLVMRRLWQEIRHRSSPTNPTIYDVLDTSRERYTRVIDTGVIRFKEGELDRWNKITGMDKGIFTGEKVFQFVYRTTSGKEIAVSANDKM